VEGGEWSQSLGEWSQSLGEWSQSLGEWSQSFSAILTGIELEGTQDSDIFTPPEIRPPPNSMEFVLF